MLITILVVSLIVFVISTLVALYAMYRNNVVLAIGAGLFLNISSLVLIIMLIIVMIKSL